VHTEKGSSGLLDKRVILLFVWSRKSAHKDPRIINLALTEFVTALFNGTLSTA
jgi:hypothetical protein